jgi:hypothetical protein
MRIWLVPINRLWVKCFVASFPGIDIAFIDNLKSSEEPDK